MLMLENVEKSLATLPEKDFWKHFRNPFSVHYMEYSVT